MFNGKKLKVLYKRHKINRHQFMFKLNESGVSVSYPTLMKWEKSIAVPDVNEISKMASIFNVDMNFFLTQ